MNKRYLVTLVIMCALVCAAHARRLTVAVGYGAQGSQGTYVCYLYKGGYLYAVKQLYNTGFVSGQADFDVPTGDAYFAMVHSQKDNTWAFSNGKYFWSYYGWMTLKAQFPR